MKRLFLLFVGLSLHLSVTPQSFDLFLNKTESGVVEHKARNSITFAPGYSYTPFGGTMSAMTVQESLSYSPVIEPEDYSIDKSLATGKTEGGLIVGSTASYAIPIDIPEGRNGLQPLLSLKYVSRFTDGFLGMGWDLEGISNISRVNKTLFSDGQADAIRGTLADKYALNGNRLVAINGTYGTANSEYRTETEEFSKVIAYGTTGTGP